MPKAKKRATPITFPRTGQSQRPVQSPMLTAYTQVSTGGEESTVPRYDFYVCHPAISSSLFVANANTAGSKRVAYGVCSLVLDLLSQFFVDLEAAILSAHGENAYWHVGAPAEGTRITHGASTSWITRPSAALGLTIANYYIANLSGFFHGVMLDEAQESIPNDYWAEYKTNTDIVLTDANRPFWDGEWKAMQRAFIGRYKSIVQEDRILIANSAGGTYNYLDGIAIESNHIATNSIPWAVAAFSRQALLRDQSPWRYPSQGPFNIAWDVPQLQSPNYIMLGRNEG